MDEPPVVSDPSLVRTKGCGKRLKSSKEKAVAKSRLCHGCGNRGVSHDKRNCPLLQQGSSIDNQHINDDDTYEPLASMAVLNIDIYWSCIFLKFQAVIIKENNFKQPGERYRSWAPDRQDRFIRRWVEALSDPRVTHEIRSIWISYWSQCDKSLGQKIGTRLDVKPSM
ncbi:catalase isozyme 2-like [Curcuma longa]|uniref:catalase isozyme 2-like n=1 Tax=Curcuma longa TaxID=136217 RepID=UPI003D9E8B6E